MDELSPKTTSKQMSRALSLQPPPPPSPPHPPLPYKNFVGLKWLYFDWKQLETEWKPVFILSKRIAAKNRQHFFNKSNKKT